MLRVTAPEGGRFWTDGRLMALLEFAQGKTYDEILKTFPTHLGSIQSVGAALDCLARSRVYGKNGTTAFGGGRPSDYRTVGFGHHGGLQQPALAGSQPPHPAGSNLFPSGNQTLSTWL